VQNSFVQPSAPIVSGSDVEMLDMT